MIDLKTKRITVTGGKGFLGTHLVRKLRDERGCSNVFIADLPEFDLRSRESINAIFDDQKPDGQPRRMLDTSRAEREFGFKAKTTFKEGLAKTITWFISSKETT